MRSDPTSLSNFMLYLTALWFSLVIWTYRDVRQRARDPLASKGGVSYTYYGSSAHKHAVTALSNSNMTQATPRLPVFVLFRF